MRKKRKYEWFIHPDQATETNDKLSAYLWEEGLITEGQKPDQIWVNGERVYGRKVPYKVITQMKKAKKVFTFIKFCVFKKEGEGKWKENFFHQERWRSIHFRREKKKLEEIRARKE